MRSRKLVALLALTFGAIVAAAPARAQATRTWVSGVGDDANPCSRTAPCKTFAGAISKTAVAGEINVLDPGGFGAVTITKSITIDGGPGIAGVLVSGTSGIVVAGAGAVVQLRNLDIDGLGSGLAGINVTTPSSVQVENSHIYGFTQQGINFAPSGATASHLTVLNTVITDCGAGVVGGAIVIKPTGGGTVDATLSGATLTRNRLGLAVFGGARASVVKSVFENNATDGVLASGAGATVRLTGVGVFDNGVGLAAVSGGSIISFGDNQNAGNATPGAPTQTIAPQ